MGDWSSRKRDRGFLLHRVGDTALLHFIFSSPGADEENRGLGDLVCGEFLREV